MKKIKLTITSLLFFAFIGSSQTNILLDGGFEFGQAPGTDRYSATYGAWTVNNYGWTTLLGMPYSNLPLQEGTNAMHIGENRLAGSVSQTFATTIGVNYQVSLWVIGWNGEVGIGTIRVFNGGTTNLTSSISSPAGNVWTQNQFAFIASGTSTTIELKNTPNAATTIDNVSVTGGCPSITLMDPTTNDGSFESNTVYSVNPSPTTLAPVWNINSTNLPYGGLLSNPPHNVVLAGANGTDALYADRVASSPNTTTATSYNLLGGTYSSVSVGDAFSWSFMVNAWSDNATGTLLLNFGNGDISIGSGTASDFDLSTFITYNGTYVATAADAAGGQLSVKFSITTGIGGTYGNVYGDNIMLSVVPTGSCNVAPVISCPTNITVNNDAGQCGAVVSFEATETVGNPASTITYSHQPGDVFPVGTTTINATATNTNGSSSCSFDVTVNDVTPPIITCAGNVSVNNDAGLCSATVTVPQPTVDDNCLVARTALDFDGINDRVVIADDNSLDFTNKYTLSAWVKIDPATPTYYMGVVSKPRSVGGTGYALVVHTGGRVLGAINDLVTNITVSSSPPNTVPIGVWTHIAYTYNGVNMKVYINGVEVGSQAYSGSHPNSSQPLYIGTEFSNNDRNFKGQIDEVRVWNYARSTTQIFNDKDDCLLGSETGLVAYYKLDDGVGSIGAFDASSNNNNGTLTNMDPATDWVASPVPSNCIVSLSAVNDFNNTDDASGTYPVGTTKVTWTTTDAAGNSATCTQDVTVNDTEAPLFADPTEIQLYNNDFENPNVTPKSETCYSDLDLLQGINALYGPGFQQKFSVEVILINGPQNAFSDPTGQGGNYALGMLSTGEDDRLALTFDAQDKDFLNVKFTLSSIDLTGCGAPAMGITVPIMLLRLYDSPSGSFNINAPGTLLDYVELTGTGNGATAFTFDWATVMASLNASASTDGKVTIEFDLINPGAYASFDNLVISASNISVENHCPENITINATGGTGAVVNYTTPFGTDNCPGANTVLTAGFASGATFPIGETTVTYRVTDAANLNAECSFTVTVTGLAPEIECPANIIVNNDAGLCSAIVNFAATETVGNPASAITYSHQPGDVFPVGTTTVTATATNTIGSSSCTFEVTVNDNEAPTINCPADVFINFGQSSALAATGSATVSDNCPGAVLSYTDASTQTASGNGHSNYTITRSWTATDVANRVASCVQKINVCDVSVSLGNNRFVFFGIPDLPGTGGTLTPVITGGLAPFTYSWSSTDASVNGATSTSVTPTGYTDAQARSYTVTVTAANGCTATSTVTITYFNINCSNNGNNVKVKVCHIPNGNKNNCKTICVSINAYQTLLDNGSYLGNCLPNCALPPIARGVLDISKYKVGNQDLNVKVFNNPTKTNFRLQVSGDLYQQISIRVMDMYGRVIEHKRNLNTDQMISIGDSYVSGMYMVEVVQGSNRKVVKLVKQ